MPDVLELTLLLLCNEMYLSPAYSTFTERMNLIGKLVLLYHSLRETNSETVITKDERDSLNIFLRIKHKKIVTIVQFLEIMDNLEQVMENKTFSDSVKFRISKFSPAGSILYSLLLQSKKMFSFAESCYELLASIDFSIDLDLTSRNTAKSDVPFQFLSLQQAVSYHKQNKPKEAQRFAVESLRKSQQEKDLKGCCYALSIIIDLLVDCHENSFPLSLENASVNIDDISQLVRETIDIAQEQELLDVVVNCSLTRILLSLFDKSEVNRKLVFTLLKKIEITTLKICREHDARVVTQTGNMPSLSISERRRLTNELIEKIEDVKAIMLYVFEGVPDDNLSMTTTEYMLSKPEALGMSNLLRRRYILIHKVTDLKTVSSISELEILRKSAFDQNFIDVYIISSLKLHNLRSSKVPQESPLNSELEELAVICNKKGFFKLQREILSKLKESF